MIVSSTTDFREAARRKLPRFLFDYIDGGAYAERTLARNVSDLADQVAAPARAEGRLQGRSVDHAVRPLPGPAGRPGAGGADGHVRAARRVPGRQGRRRQGRAVLPVDRLGLRPGRGVQGQSTPIWFQLYVLRDRGFMRDLLAKAADAGATALVFTVDMPVPGARYRDAHSGMSGPNAAMRRLVQAAFKPAWAWDVGVMGRPHTLGNVAPVLGANSGLEDFMGWLGANFDPSIQWKDLEWIRDLWKGPLIIKGVLDPEDAKAAADIGADGIVVSNHGGRQLDGVLSSAKALPAIAEAVGDRLTVLADSGVRSGLDVVRMLALGAKGVLLGRAWVYALAARGGPGVSQLLDLIEKEMRVAMALTGVNTLNQIDRSILAKL
jgi:L-lactate dehydrogenase (cytochrome)